MRGFARSHFSQSPFPNYGFAEDSAGKKELEKYIKENKRLPEVASAAKMEQYGVDLGEMNIKLLQKIEELKLSIESNKEIRELRSEVKQLKVKP